MFIIIFSWSSSSNASLATNMRVIVVSPFSYSEDGVPENVREEMAIDVDLAQATIDYFKEVNAFKSVSILNSDSKEKADADLFVHGEILYVNGGSGAGRYFGGLGGAGRASMLVGIKVFDKEGQLLYEGRVTQVGTKGTNIWTAWSNKKNITSAIKVLPQKILPVAIGGDLTTSDGVIRSLESGNSLAIRAAAKSAYDHELFREKSVTDAMENLVLQEIDNNNDDRYIIDGMAWCLKNIGDSGDHKYIASLDKILKSDAHKKIKEHAKYALDNIEKSGE